MLARNERGEDFISIWTFIESDYYLFMAVFLDVRCRCRDEMKLNAAS